jgi:hypothetical protein
MQRFNFILLCTTLLMFSALGFGQAISGDLVGTVIDKSGAVVPNAAVDAVNEGTGVASSTTTNSAGEYRFSNLPVGTYDITAAAPAFGATTLKGFVVELNKTASVRIILDVGKVATAIEVTDAAPPIDTTTAQVATTYGTAEAQNLPTASVGLGILNLSLLQAGVSNAGGVNAGVGPSVGGQRPRNNNFTVEGVDNNDKTVTGPLVYIPNDAIGNFSILQNQYTPEFGHSTGGQFNAVVQSGTNTFHGRVYEYFQNRNLNAVDVSNANQGITTNPRFDNNRFGGQVGGPVIKNKLFFFANYEYNPIGQASTPGSPVLAPTSVGYAALAGIKGVSATNVGILQQFAVAPSACTAAQIGSKICPNGGALAIGPGKTPVQVGVLPIVAPNFSNQHSLTTALDYNISAKDQLRGRYIYNNLSLIDNSATLPAFFTSEPNLFDLVTISEYHTFSPTINNELRLGFNRFSQNIGSPNITFPGLDAFPNIQLEDLNGLNIGPDPNAPQSRIQNYYTAVDNVTWNKGKHSLKFGVEGGKYIAPQKFIQRSRGDYDYNTLNLFLTDGVPDNLAERSFGSVGYSGDQYNIYSFVNDTWKVRQNLSLNLGLRYEYTSTPFGWTQQSLNSVASVPGLITFGSPQAPKRDFMPRVGFAWAPGGSGKTSIRGGFGIGYDVLYDNIGTLSRPPQIGSTTDCPGGQGCATGNFLANGGIKNTGQTGITTLSVADARANTSAFLPNNVQYPYSEQWNLGVQHTFGNNYTAEVRYLGSRGVHLNVQDRLNRISPVDANHSLPTFLSAPTQAQLNGLTTTLAQLQALPSFSPAFTAAGFLSNITAFEPFGGSSYHSLATQLNRRFSNGLQFQAAWTWSHNIDDSTADFFSTVLTPRRPQDFQNLHPDRSNSALDRAHRVTVTAIYDVPFFKNRNGFIKNIAGNWEIAPIYTFETGEWADVQSAADANLNGDTAGDRAIFNPAGVPGTGSDVTALKNSAGQTVAYLANNPNAQYIRARAGALANSSRNTLQLPPTNNWDISVAKHISLRDRYRFEFGAQMFNAFNHPQFVGGSINQVTTNNAQNALLISNATKNFLTPGATNFDVPSVTFPSNARQIQLSGKFIF